MAVTTDGGAITIALTVADPRAAAAFYCTALGFRQTGETRGPAARFGAVGTAHIVELTLGAQIVLLCAFDPPGAPYPVPRTSHDPWFQHFAIVTADIAQAWARLCATPGTAQITTGGPQTLPAAAGGVIAAKFRDPEGHPLELLQFPAERIPARWQGARGLHQGIDHSAIVVRDTARSIAFYRGLGFEVISRSLNQGAEQERLDDAAAVRVQVTGLARPAAAPPHLELLCYEAPSAPPPRAIAPNDIACTRLMLPAIPARQQDPDGHRFLLQTA